MRSQDSEQPEKKKRWSAKRAVLLLLLLLLVAVGLYVAIEMRRGRSLQEILLSAVTTSEDAATTAAVKTSLALSKRLSVLAIDVDTRHGIVTLTGEVSSEEVKELAEAVVADTAGVRGVNNLLSVDPSARPDPELEHLTRRIADLETRAEVQDALAQDRLLGTARIEAQVSDGNVALTGTVETTGHKHRAEQLVRQVESVRTVANELVVMEAESQPEEQEVDLAQRVEFRLFSTDAFDLERIEIEARGGEIYLEGRVGSRAEQLLAEMVAASVEGVAGVVNDLHVADPARPEMVIPEEPDASTVEPEDETEPSNQPE